MLGDWHDVLREVGPDRLRESHEQTTLNGEDVLGEPPSVMSLAQLLAKETSLCSWIVQDILPAGGTSLLVGKPKEGKSTLARMLACDVVAGCPFLGRYPTTKGAVLYWAFEESEHHVREQFLRLMASASGGAAIDPELIDFAPGGREPTAMQFAQTLERKQYALAIVDPLIRLVTLSDINAYSSVYAELSKLVDLARRTKTHVMLVHHAGKGKRSGADVILGSQALFGAVDAALLLARGRGGRGVIKSHQRYGNDLAPVQLLFDPASGRFQIVSPQNDDQSNEQFEHRILEVLAGEVLTEAEIRKGVGGNQSLTAKALRKLVKEGRVLRDCSGRRQDPYRYRAAVPPVRTNNEQKKADSSPTSIRNRENRESRSYNLNDDGTSVTSPPGSQTDPPPEEALGDDRDVLADLARRLGYPSLASSGRGFPAHGESSWSRFLPQASAAELTLARGELDRMNAAVSGRRPRV
jgi:hypothetical protein